jgi:hypothetical protein
MSAAINSNGAKPDGRSGSLIQCEVDQLRPHPAYASLDIAVSAPVLSALVERGDTAFQEPLLITRERTIVDGYDRWELAKRQGRPTLPCVENDPSEQEALVWLLQKLRPSKGVNNFCRILLALELEPCLKQRAHANQQHGGLRKGSSNLTEAERLDVRSETAAAAGVSTGNVNKVKQILSDARPELILALRTSEVSIHRAWCWLKEPDRQAEHLDLFRDRCGITKTVNDLLRAHRDHGHQGPFDLSRLAHALAELDSKRREGLLIAEIKVPGEVLLLSPTLLSVLSTCVTKQTGDMVYSEARRLWFLGIGQHTTMLYALERESDHGSTSAVFGELSKRRDVGSGPVPRVWDFPPYGVSLD